MKKSRLAAFGIIVVTIVVMIATFASKHPGRHDAGPGSSGRI